MKEKLTTGIIGIIELVTMSLWMGCKNFRSMMDISSVNVRLQLEDYIHNDSDTSFFFIRLFHNKIVGWIINTFDKYLKYWDIRFTINIFSLVGVFGIGIGLWYVYKSKAALFTKIGILCLLVFWPLPFALDVLRIPFFYKFMVFISPYYVLSLFGIWSFLKNKGKYAYILLLVLSFLSLWWLFILPKEVAYFCVQ